MADARPSVLSKLPGISFATLAATGETIAICRGEPNYYRVESTRTADELNALYGVSQAQARAMLAGVMQGWDAPQVDPARYEEDAGKATEARSRPA
ncbi:hypothetical protein SVA_0923 [Sulfurifustis variabilis]|uniref:Uncharacterized protein n=1 Tax=Sulfurifustis variabilis TaxID=1675686 RepID=A0A1B4V4M2_9GAMM|nr:hypothetical protein [Sulfurifustis variabilis]BAU47502.1 hypothetical protein SVA_0923 [Sulfurifustis variabilis]